MYTAVQLFAIPSKHKLHSPEVFCKSAAVTLNSPVIVCHSEGASPDSVPICINFCAPVASKSPTFSVLILINGLTFAEASKYTSKRI